MTLLRLWRRFSRHGDSRLTTLLAVLAFAVATAALLTVLGGMLAFLERSAAGDLGSEGYFYVTCAIFATVVLVVPILTLGGAAARLSMARRNERMAALRLAGATSAQVGGLTLIDTTLQAVLGVLIGAGLYAAAIPAVALVPFAGRGFTPAELWVGPSRLALMLLGVVALALLSAVLSLVQVATTPLGVAQRVSPRAMSVLRIALLVVGLLTWAAISRRPSILGLALGLGFCFAMIAVAGPFVLWLVGRIAAGSARSVEQLLAARRLVDDPRGAWRIVGGVSMATFVAGLTSVAPTITSAAGDSLGADIATGAALTLGIAALLSAVSTGVLSAVSALDERPTARLLWLAGTDLATLARARRRQVLLPLGFSVGLAAAGAMLIVAPFGIAMITGTWQGIALFLGGAAVAVALVVAAVQVTQPLLLAPLRGRD